MSLKTENSRRVAKLHPVCMGLYNKTSDKAATKLVTSNLGYTLSGPQQQYNISSNNQGLF